MKIMTEAKLRARISDLEAEQAASFKALAGEGWDGTNPQKETLLDLARAADSSCEAAWAEVARLEAEVKRLRVKSVAYQGELEAIRVALEGARQVVVAGADALKKIDVDAAAKRVRENFGADATTPTYARGAGQHVESDEQKRGDVRGEKGADS